jgi:squalene synthase HpnC
MIRRVVEPRPNAEPAPLLDPPPGARWSIDRAFDYCERLARGHYENFPVASRFLPARLRRHVWSVYAFARSADDFADEPRYAGRRAEALDYWETELERAYHGEADHPVFIALSETIEACDLPVVPLRDMLTAFTMDLSVSRYPTWAALERYCAHSAHPVGRVVLYIFGYRDPSLHAFSDDICTGLQLANFLQDVAIDLTKGRIYLPEEDLRHFGVSESSLLGRLGPRGRDGEPAFRDLMRFEVARARALLERGRPLVDKVGRQLGFELSMIWHGGATILDKIEAVDYDVFRRRPQLNRADKARLMARAASERWPLWTR